MDHIGMKQTPLQYCSSNRKEDNGNLSLFSLACIGLIQSNPQTCTAKLSSVPPHSHRYRYSWDWDTDEAKSDTLSSKCVATVISGFPSAVYMKNCLAAFTRRPVPFNSSPDSAYFTTACWIPIRFTKEYLYC